MWLSGWEAALKAFKIIGLAAVIFWMAFITLRVERAVDYAQQACVYAAVAKGEKTGAWTLDACR